MTCKKDCEKQPVTTCECGGYGNNYVCIIVLYILLAIILGSVFF